MSIIKSFGELYDKTLQPTFADYRESADAFEVNEHDHTATTKLLRIEQTGAKFASFNHTLVKGIGDITERRSSRLQDSDCDGVTFVSHHGHDGLIFSELKSKFSTKKIYEAFQQMTYSFLKMHAMLSLCTDYSLDVVSLHFIAACQCFEDKNQEDGIYNRLSKVEKDDRQTFEGTFMRKLIEQHDVEVSLGDVAKIMDIPLSPLLTGKNLTLSLQVTQNYGDNQLVYSF